MSKPDPVARIAENVAQLLKTERIRRQLSMSQVASGAGLSQQMVSYVERGMRNPTLDTLLRIARVLKVDLWKILRSASRQNNLAATSRISTILDRH